MPKEPYPGLQVEEDLRFEKRDWLVERIGWAIMLLAAVAALLGLLGPGPLTRLTATSPSGQIKVDYYRFDRSEAENNIKVKLTRPPLRDGQLQLWISHDTIDWADVLRVQPQPLMVQSDQGRYRYVFPAAGETETISIHFRYIARDFGGRTVRLGIEGGEEVSYRIFVYP